MQRPSTTRLPTRLGGAFFKFSLGLSLAWLLASAADAHRQSYSYTWTSGGTGTYVPDLEHTHNEGAGTVVATRLGQGFYEVVFHNLDQVNDPYENVHVSAYGNVSTSCQLFGWTGTTVLVFCYDTAGAAADAAFTVLFVKEEPHSDEIAYTWADQPTNPAYPGSSTSSFNPTGGGVAISRASVGTYLVAFPGMASVGSGGGHVQITTYGSAPARCKTSSWGSDSVNVRCFDFSGAAVDSAFTLLFKRPAIDRDGIAFAWVDSALGNPATPHPTYSYNAGGGAVQSRRTSVGRYEVEFTGFSTVGINRGNVQVTAYGTSADYCHVDSWGSTTVEVRCQDSTGTLTDTTFNVLYLKTPRGVLTQTYAFAHGDQPSATMSYTANPNTSYNQGGDPVSIERLGTGIYRVDWPGMSPLGGDDGAVVASLRGSSAGSCKISGWVGEFGEVRCFDTAGSPADREFDILFLKPWDGTPGVAYAWANAPVTPSYPPLDLSAHNPTGGAMLIERTGTGEYQVSFTGYGAEPAAASHVQVTAFGTSSVRCEVDSWTGDNVFIDCYNAAGAPADSRFIVVYLRPDDKRDGVAFAWADDPLAPFYNPFAAFSYNPSEDDIDLQRIGVGNYRVTLHGINEIGIDGRLPHTQVTTYDSPGNHCRVAGSGTFAVDVNCFDPAGAPADTKYDLLVLKPVHVPEPSWLLMLAAGIVSLGALARYRRQRG